MLQIAFQAATPWSIGGRTGGGTGAPCPHNPRPDTVFRHLRSDRGGGVGATPLGVSKRSVVELSGKDQQIALAEYSRLMVLFLVLG